jgi:hypothetical protein
MARSTGRIVSGCALTGALLLAASPGSAIGPPGELADFRAVPLLQPPGEPVALGPSFEARFFAPTVPLRIGPRPGQSLYFDQRTFGPLRYSTPVSVAHNDVVLHLEAPGQGISLVEFEIEF